MSVPLICCVISAKRFLVAQFAALCDLSCVRSVMVLKKLGDELMPEFHSVVEYLGGKQGMQVVVEPHEHAKMVHRLCKQAFALYVLHGCHRLLAIT